MKTTRSWLAGAVAMFAVIGIAASCAPTAPGGGPATTNWAFKGTSVKVNASQDAIYDPFFGACIAIPNCKDEPYLLNIGFRVKIGVPGSAEAFVVNPRTDAPENVAVGQTVNVVGTAAESKTTFNGVQALDLLDLADPNNHLEITGTFVWASEEDSIGNGLMADGVADVLKDGLNATLGANGTDLANLDASVLVNLILNNIGSAFGILVNNFPTLGLGDDILGSGIYIGIGATGALGSAIDAVAGSATIPTINLPIIPDITGGGIYTLTGPKTFTQTFTGGGGQHTWTLQSGPA